MVRYNKGLFVNQHDNQVVQHVVSAGFDSLIGAVSKWPGFEKYAEKLKKHQAKLFEKSTSIGIMNEDDFNVLNHGDMWLNNILFRYEQSGRPVDLRFVSN